MHTTIHYISNRDCIPDNQIMTRKEVYKETLRQNPNSPEIELNEAWNSYNEWLDEDTRNYNWNP